MILRNIRYDLPVSAYLFFGILALIGMFWFLFLRRKEILKGLSSSSYHQQLLIERGALLYWGKVLFFCITWICAVFALMGPKGNERYPISPTKETQKSTLKLKPHEVILLIDASASMSVNDTKTGITRLDYAKEIADQIISELKGENVSLYAFTSKTLQLSPSTLDYLYARLMIKGIKINEGDTSGTDILQALQYLKNEYFSVPTSKLKTLIILSDGGDTKLESLHSTEKEERIHAMLAELGNAQENNLRVYTIGMGSKAGKEIPNIFYNNKPVVSAENEELLRILAARGRGGYYYANEMTSLEIAQALLKDIAQDNPFIELKDQTQFSNRGQPIYDLYYQFPLGVAIIFLSLVILVPETFRKIGYPILCFCLLWNVPGYALDFTKEERLAQNYYEAKDFDQARGVYEEMLITAPSSPFKSFILYNIGTILSAQGKWEQASSKFNEAIKDIGQNLLFAKRLYINFAITNFRIAEASNDKEKNIFIYQQILSDLSKAKKANCELTRYESLQNECLGDPEIAVLEETVKKKLISLIGSASLESSIEARLGILVANHLFVSAIRSFFPIAPERILKNSIEDQDFALKLERLQQQSPQISSQIHKMTVDAQSEVLEQAQPFLAQVFIQQVKEFQESKRRCQKRPWDEVIPLFNEGWENAKTAQIRGIKTIDFQEKALQKWKEALEKMILPRETPESQSEKPSQAESKGLKNLNQILTELQEMEHDDKSSPLIETRPSKKEEMPW